jgi:hypothetical protein
VQQQQAHNKILRASSSAADPDSSLFIFELYGRADPDLEYSFGSKHKLSDMFMLKLIKFVLTVQSVQLQFYYEN